MSDWQPTRWWRAVYAEDGRPVVWAESSDEDEVREHAAKPQAVRLGVRIEHLHERVEREWRTA